MNLDIIILSISLMIFSAWSIRIYYKVFDKTIKKYAISISVLLILWCTIKIIKSFKGSNLLWYLFYIALIFMPTFYYLCSRYLVNKESKTNKYIIYTISTLLLVLVLTNDFHQFVFKFDYKDYRNYIGYFIVLFWIMYLLITSTINLLQKSKQEKSIKSFIPFIPILIGLIYTILYVYEIPYFIRKINMTVVIGWLFVIGIENIFSMELIPNNLQYEKVFKNSYLPIAIVNNKGDLVYQTSKKIHISKTILDEIKSEKVKEIYESPDNNDQVYEIGSFKEGYSIIKKDFSKIEKLKQELKIKNEKLNKQRKSLINQKNIKDKLYEIKMNNEILERLEYKIDKNRSKIENILDNMEEANKDDLENIKYLISYCKRMSNLIISNYNNEIYNKEKMDVIFKELLEDSCSRGIYGVVNIDDNIILNSSVVTEIYEILFLIFQTISNVGVLVNIEKKYIKIIFDDNIEFVENILIDKKQEGIISNIIERDVEEGKEVFIELFSN